MSRPRAPRDDNAIRVIASNAKQSIFLASPYSFLYLLQMLESKQPCVYIMANKPNGTLYTGVTSNLIKRIWQHQNGQADAFTKLYGCKRLAWYEIHETMESAITREKQIKAGSRAAKVRLILKQNPDWSDLYPSIVG